MFLRGARLSYAGALLGLGLSVLIATQSVRAAVVAGGALTALCGLACIVVMPETGFRRRLREERTGTFGELGTTALAGGRFRMLVVAETVPRASAAHEVAERARA